MVRTNRMTGYDTYSSLGVAFAFAACLALIALMSVQTNPSLTPAPTALSEALGQVAP